MNGATPVACPAMSSTAVRMRMATNGMSHQSRRAHPESALFIPRRQVAAVAKPPHRRRTTGRTVPEDDNLTNKSRIGQIPHLLPNEYGILGVLLPRVNGGQDQNPGAHPRRSNL